MTSAVVLKAKTSKLQAWISKLSLKSVNFASFVVFLICFLSQLQGSIIRTRHKVDELPFLCRKIQQSFL